MNSGMLDGEPGSTEDPRGIVIEKLMTARSWRKDTACHEGLHGEVKAGAGREGQNRVRTCLNKVCEWSALGYLS